MINIDNTRHTIEKIQRKVRKKSKREKTKTKTKNKYKLTIWYQFERKDKTKFFSINNYKKRFVAAIKVCTALNI